MNLVSLAECDLSEVKGIFTEFHKGYTLFLKLRPGALPSQQGIISKVSYLRNSARI